MELIHIKGGRFIMGSKRETEHQTTSNEQPHPVTLDSDFWLGKYEVTQFQYERIMGNNPSYFKGERLPVDYIVSWKDAMEFCRRLNVMSQKKRHTTRRLFIQSSYGGAVGICLSCWFGHGLQQWFG